tara:strand:- start:1377 stop:1868 length:492 start_codon:yes stop_codon:yes gene_type:complete
MANIKNAQTFSGAVTTSSDLVVDGAFKKAAGAVNGYFLQTDAIGTGTWAPVSGAPSTATVQTTDATPTTLLSISLGASSVLTLNGIVEAADAAYTDATGGSLVATALRAAGAAINVGAPFVAVLATSTGTFNVAVSGNNLVVTVTGIAATTYNWKITYTVSTN